ncbi:MAG: lactate racemase domain-containing protein [Pseudomonadota bacterium]
MLPTVVRVRQAIKADPLGDIDAAVSGGVAKLDLASRTKPGDTVAVGCSSRGIANYGQVVASTVIALKEAGLKPFLFPAMGSHGAATAEGQRQVLIGQGIEPGALDVTIESSLDFDQIADLDDLGIPVLIDRHANGADHIVLINRVKSHTEFTHSFESGLMKMMAIGMGKEEGATLYHKAFMVHGYAPVIRAIADTILDSGKILFGVGIVEDGRAQTAAIDVLAADELVAGEEALLRQSKAFEPRLPLDDIDVLLIDEMGKDISGSGFDTKVVGRINMPLVTEDPETPRIKRIVVCDLTAASAGNADGVGSADFITKRLYDKIDIKALYVNAIAGSEPEHARIPMVMETAREATAAAAGSVGLVATDDLRLVRIRNTLRLEEIDVSTACLTDLAGKPDVTVMGEPGALDFGADDELLPFDG